MACSRNDVNAALACAESFLRLAEPLILRIPEIEESTSSQPFSLGIGDAAAGATNLAFAIELYIKAILSRINVSWDRAGHDLVKLYRTLPQDFKVLIGHFYDERRKTDWKGKYRSITIVKQRAPASVPAWPEQEGDARDIEALLDRSSDTFTAFRYIYEFRNPDAAGRQWHPLEYDLLLSACRALRDTVECLQSPSANSTYSTLI